jgi:TonB family protein
MKTPTKYLQYILTGAIVLINFIYPLLMAQNISQPKCYGGSRLMRDFIKEEMVYPDKALSEGIEGIVIISFRVNANGSTSDFKVKQSLSKETDAEAIRICRMIQWFPATDLGRPVDYIQSLDFKFDINKYQTLVKSRGYDKIEYSFIPVDTSYTIYPMLDVDISPKPIYSSEDYNFSSFISNHLEYPEAAFKQNISGTVKLKFVIEPSGRISNILTEKAVGGGCTEEAISVVKLLRWNPGILKEKAVRTWMCLEITFDIAKRSVNGAIPSPGQVH